jgi:magnesium transporter
MITVFTRDDGRIVSNPLEYGQIPSPYALWIDLQEPDDHERVFISTHLNIDLPNRLEMSEIEASSRLYAEGDAIYMTTDVLIGFDTIDPTVDVLLIAASPNCMVTVHYRTPKSIQIFANRLKIHPELFASVDDGLLAFLDTISDRTADILEALGRQLDTLSRQVFNRPPPPNEKLAVANGTTKPLRAKHKEAQLQAILQGIGNCGDLTHKVHSSINGVSRLLAFLGPRLTPRLSTQQVHTFHALELDVRSLDEHAQFITQETAFLLDAALGLINIEQNNIIKIMSVVMVAFTPPTFFASMWGMNFHDMPEYALSWGYPMALTVMIISAIIPVLYVRKRGWL